MKQDFPVYFKRYLEQFPRSHTEHFFDLTYGLLQICRDRNLLDVPEADIPIIAMAACLHDLGKTALSSPIAYHTGALTPAELAIYETHTLMGATILSSLELPGFQDSRFYEYGWQICLNHHERWDGDGYPRGLKGEQIPSYVQIVHLAIQYDLLRTPRPNRSAYPPKKAMERLLADHGAFDPQLLASVIFAVDENLDTLISPKDDAGNGQNQPVPPAESCPWSS